MTLIIGFFILPGHGGKYPGIHMRSRTAVDLVQRWFKRRYDFQLDTSTELK